MLRFGLVVAAAALIADFLSKWLILDFVMQPPRRIPVLPFFDLVLAWNPGVSFGLFQTGSALGPWIFSGLAMTVVVALCIWLTRIAGRRLAAGVGLIVGGAVGNVVDRLRFGAVVDFLDFHLGMFHWPAFNIADSAITIGVAIVLLDSLFGRDESSK